MDTEPKLEKCYMCDLPDDVKPDILSKKLNECQVELRNFQDIIRYVVPTSGEIPCLPGIDIYGRSLFLNGLVGGDHIVYVDFNQRYDMERIIAEARESGKIVLAEKLRLNTRRAGVLLADVSGHQITDAVLSAMLHQAFLIGVHYELKENGEITTDLFENLNTRFFHSSSQFKYITMIYGEIWDNGRFRFLSAAHPPPIVFSREYNRLVSIGAERMIHFPPIGTMPSEGNWEAKCCPEKKRLVRLKGKYAVEQIKLMGKGDIMILCTDGLSEHMDETDTRYFPGRLEEILKKTHEAGAREIFDAVAEDVLRFSPALDDISFVVIKKK